MLLITTRNPHGVLSFSKSFFLRKSFAFAIVLFWFNLTHAQVLSEDQKPSLVPIGHFDLPNYKEQIDMVARGADPSGFQTNDSVMRAVLSEIGQRGVVLYFGPGTFQFKQSIHLKSNVIIRGANSDSTTLLFDLNGRNHCINVRGENTSESRMISGELKNGQSHLEIYSLAIDLLPGQVAFVQQDDSSWITSSWAKSCVGQFVEIDKVEADKALLKYDLRHDYFAGLNSRLSTPNFVQNVGIENLKIVRRDQTTSQTSNIFFQYAKDCWVYGVHSDSSNFAHVTFDRSYHNLVTGCFFENAFDFGGGGKAYGVVLQQSSSDHVVENNAFRNLRHSMLLQAGANGNIVAYNYSREPNWTGTFFPTTFSGDLVLHGNYVYSNLFEGNVVQNIVIDNSHGMNGPRNTFLRNRAEHAGLFMNASQVSDSQLFIGNEIVGEGYVRHNSFQFPKGLYSLAGKGHFEYGNYHQGKMVPDEVSEMVNSYYLQNAPSFWTSNSPWPCIGYPNDAAAKLIPAQERGLSAQYTVPRVIFAPVEKFKGLVAQKKTNNVVLNWHITQGKSTSNFVIEKYDTLRKEYKEIGQISQGTLAEDQMSFSFVDYQLMLGLNRYRVKQFDNNDYLLYSDVVEVEHQRTSGLDIMNEIGSARYSFVLSATRLKVRLYTCTGRKVFEEVSVNQNPHRLIDLSGLEEGIYTLQIEGGNKSYVKQIRLLARQ